MNRTSLKSIYSILLFSFMVLPLLSNSQNKVAQYSFSGNANDISGNNLNGYVYGATLTTDRFGNANSAYSFDGFNDYILIPNNPLINFDNTDDFSLSIWIKIPSTQNYLYGAINSIYHKWEDNGGGNQPYYLKFEVFNQTDVRNGTLLYARFDQGCGGFQTEFSTTKVNDDNWKHFVITKQGNKIRTYINAVLESAYMDDITCTTLNSNDLYIGKRGGSINKGYLKGVVDDINIFDYAIDEYEIHDLHNGTPPINDGPMTGIESIDKLNDIVLYPNPSEGIITISSDATEQNIEDVKIYNSNSQLILTETDIKAGKVIVDLSSQNVGFYVAKIRTPLGVQFRKFIITR